MGKKLYAIISAVVVVAIAAIALTINSVHQSNLTAAKESSIKKRDSSISKSQSNQDSSVKASQKASSSRKSEEESKSIAASTEKAANANENTSITQPTQAGQTNNIQTGLKSSNDQTNQQDQNTQSNDEDGQINYRTSIIYSSSQPYTPPVGAYPTE